MLRAPSPLPPRRGRKFLQRTAHSSHLAVPRHWQDSRGVTCSDGEREWRRGAVGDGTRTSACQDQNQVWTRIGRRLRLAGGSRLATRRRSPSEGRSRTRCRVDRAPSGGRAPTRALVRAHLGQATVTSVDAVGWDSRRPLRRWCCPSRSPWDSPHLQVCAGVCRSSRGSE